MGADLRSHVCAAQFIAIASAASVENNLIEFLIAIDFDDKFTKIQVLQVIISLKNR